MLDITEHGDSELTIRLGDIDTALKRGPDIFTDLESRYRYTDSQLDVLIQELIKQCFPHVVDGNYGDKMQFALAMLLRERGRGRKVAPDFVWDVAVLFGVKSTNLLHYYHMDLLASSDN